MSAKFLDINKQVIQALFLVDGEQDDTGIENQVNDILETHGKISKEVRKKAVKEKVEEKKTKTTKKATKAKVEEPAKPVRKLFKNR